KYLARPDVKRSCTILVPSATEIVGNFVHFAPLTSSDRCDQWGHLDTAIFRKPQKGENFRYSNMTERILRRIKAMLLVRAGWEKSIRSFLGHLCGGTHNFFPDG